MIICQVQAINLSCCGAPTYSVHRQSDPRMVP